MVPLTKKMGVDGEGDLQSREQRESKVNSKLNRTSKLFRRNSSIIFQWTGNNQLRFERNSTRRRMMGCNAFAKGCDNKICAVTNTKGVLKLP